MALGDVMHWLREVSGVARAERLRLAQHDPWRRLDLVPPLALFGPGAIDDFSAYLQRASRVAVATPADVARWLMQCRYAEDSALLGEHDHWQHPCTFEVVRSGDCEDFSLWAWRKLVEAQYDADFVVGHHHRGDGVSGRHAWVHYRENGVEYVLDGVQRTLDRIIVVSTQAQRAYEPQVGVASDGRRFVFAGLYRTEWGRRLVLPRHKR